MNNNINIATYPSEILRQKASPIEEIDDIVCQWAQDMLETMYEFKGVGLAAPQVGWSKRLIVIDVTGQKEGERVFINPFIAYEEGIAVAEEGCLSFPRITGNVARSAIVEVVAYNLKGERLQIKADGLLARALQHEIDHLDGVLFIDKMTPGSRLVNGRKIKELERAYQDIQV